MMKAVGWADFDSEVKSLKDFSGHPSFVAYIKHTPSTRSPMISKAYIMMEAATGGNLGGIVGDRRVGSDDRKQLFFDMLVGVEHMHNMKRVHRDLKPANVFVTASCFSDSEQCHAKVGDLGLACDMSKRGDCSGVAGTPLYMAPELFKSPPTISYSNDVWALGLMLYELTFLRLPAKLENAATMDSLYRDIKTLKITDDYNFKKYPGGSRKDLMRGLLEPSPRSRFSAKEAVGRAAAWIGSGLKTASAMLLPDCLGRDFGAQISSGQKAYEQQLLEAKKYLPAKAPPTKPAEPITKPPAKRPTEPAKKAPERRPGPPYLPQKPDIQKPKPGEVKQPVDEEPLPGSEVPQQTEKKNQKKLDNFVIDVTTGTTEGKVCCNMLLDPSLKVVFNSGRVRMISGAMIKQCSVLAKLKHNQYIIKVNSRAFTDVKPDLRMQWCNHGKKELHFKVQA
jgi:hypothetical protein